MISKNTGWVEDENDFRLTATDMQPLVLQIPRAEVCELIFDAGPQQGQVIIIGENGQEEFNLYLDADAEYGISYQLQYGMIPGAAEENNRIAFLAVASIMTLMLSALWFLGKKEKGTAKSKTVRNASIECVRFVIIMCVCIHHYCGYCPGGYLGVDFFFILSGFLLMKQFAAQKNTNQSPLTASWEYVKKRYVKLISYYVIPAGMAVIINVCLNNMPSLHVLVADGIWEMTMLQGFGFTENLLIGPGWFCSALLICSYFIYLLLSVNSERFIGFIAPVSILFIMGYMSHRVGHLNYWLRFETNTVISIALLRGFAEMSIGCLCYVVSLRLRAKIENKYRLLNAAMELFCLWGIMFIITRMGQTKMDYIAVLLMAFVITSFFIGNSILCKLLNNRVCRWLGKISISIYLTHSVIGRINWAQLLPISWHASLIVYLVFVLVFSCVTTSFVDRMMLLADRKGK